MIIKTTTTTTITDDKGKLLKGIYTLEDGTRYRNGTVETVWEVKTERQWNLEKRKLKPDAEPIEIKISSHGGYPSYYDYYEKKSTLKMTEADIKRYKKEEAEAKAKRKLEREREWRNRYLFSNYWMGWQLVKYEHRIPIDPEDVWEVSSYEHGVSPYSYYKWKNSKPITDEEYEKLKELWIAKYGSWDRVPEPSKYDGTIWWDEDDLKQTATDDEELRIMRNISKANREIQREQQDEQY